MQIVLLLPVAVQLKYLRQTAVSIIFLPRLNHRQAAGFVIFTKGKRPYPDVLSPAAELGHHIRGEKPGVGPRNIYLQVGLMHQAQQHFYEAVCLLHLVENDIIDRAVFCGVVVDIFEELHRVAQSAVSQVIKRQLDDVVVLYALLFEILMKQVEQQERFPAPPAAGNYFHQSVAPASGKHINIILPRYYHAIENICGLPQICAAMIANSLILSKFSSRYSCKITLIMQPYYLRKHKSAIENICGIPQIYAFMMRGKYGSLRIDA